MNGVFILIIGKYDYKKSKKEVKLMKDKVDMKFLVLGIMVIFFIFYCYCLIFKIFVEIDFRNDIFKCGIFYVYIYYKYVNLYYILN